MTTSGMSRRAWLHRTGLSAAMLPWVGGLPSLVAAPTRRPKQRLVIVFSPNGVVPDAFWPKETGTAFQLPEILQPLESLREQTLILQGVDNRIRGDGDDHMRGMSCLLTAIELFPGNIQGGGNTPSGWPRGHSIDQELKSFLQADDTSRTLFGSLEFGVLVPHRADVWTRMVYAGPNRPIAPISNPYQMFRKLYGDRAEQETVASVLDAVAAELQQIRQRVSSEDRHLLEDHLNWVRQTEVDLQASAAQQTAVPPALEQGVPEDNEQMPRLSDLQQDLLVSAFRNDLTRIATLQYTNSVGNARMKFLGIEEGHHELSHDPDEKQESVAKLTKINLWYCQQIVALANRLAAVPEPDGEGTLLDHTTILWTNELGKGNSHTLNSIPFVLVGRGAGFQMGRALKFEHLPHNRLWISLAHAFGHSIESFGNPELSKGGVVDELFG